MSCRAIAYCERGRLSVVPSEAERYEALPRDLFKRLRTAGLQTRSCLCIDHEEAGLRLSSELRSGVDLMGRIGFRPQ